MTPAENPVATESSRRFVRLAKNAIALPSPVDSPAANKARLVFCVDSHGMVRHQVVNDLPLGRNVDEMLRMVDALQFTETHGEVCPAGWNKGKAGMKASTAGVAEYLAEHATSL